MKKLALPHSRGPQILKLLAEHGPLSVRGLTEIIPETNSTRLRECLQRLQRRKYVEKMYDRHFGGAGVFYKITQNDDHWDSISKIVRCNPSELFQPQFRKQELLHSESCAIWAEKLKTLFPSATILHDYTIEYNETAKNCLLNYGDEKELLPDLLVLIRNNVTKTNIAVAVEIEKTLKSRRRLVRKLRKYTNESRLDGVFYICDESAIAKRIKCIYLESILPEAITISRYGHNFLLFKNKCETSDLKTTVYNSSLKDIELSSWVEYLMRHQLGERCDSEFDFQLSTTGNF